MFVFGQIICASYHSFAITTDGNVFSWGYNYNGQLGLGHNDNQNKPQLVEFFENKQVRNIICGMHHTMAITESGEVFSWGYNCDGQLGLGHENDQNIPKLVEFFEGKQVRDICGGLHSIAITESGEVFSWGKNYNGQLGLGHENTQNIPRLVNFFVGKQVRNIICGEYHTMAITESGEVFSWGYNNYGQLGLGHYDNQNIPQLVEFFEGKQVRNIVCGGFHTMAITESGEVFSWGKNNNGQLGLGHYDDQNIPQLIEFFEGKQVRNIICRAFHAMAITEFREVFSWGWNNNSQFGLDHKNNQNIPQLVEFFEGKQVRNIVCGKNHTIAITESGKVFSWGANNCGQLGLGHHQEASASQGHENNQNIPHLVEFFEEHKIMPEKITRIKSTTSAIY